MTTRVAVLVSMVVLAGCTGRPGSPRKEPLARLPQTFLAGSATVSDDFAHHAYLVEDDDGTRVVRDGVAGEAYREATNRSFFPTSPRHLYWARRPEGEALVVVDDVPYPIGYSRHEYVAFDRTGTHWALLASPATGDGAMLLVDGRTLGPFADASVPVWSPDGAVTYLRAHGEPGPQRRVELVGGDAVLRQSPARASTCLPAIGEPLRGPEMPLHAAVRYLADGRLLTLMPQESQWTLERDGQVLGRFEASGPTAPGSVGPYTLAGGDGCASGTVIAATTLITAEKAPVAAWWERTGGADGAWRVVVDGTPAADVRCLRPWPHQPPQLAADGRTVAFPCVVRFDDHGEAIMVVHGERQYGPYPEVWALALSEDGRRLAYGASDGSLEEGWAIYADGEQQSPRYYAVWRPRFDPTGTHLAWEAMRRVRGPNDLVLDGRRLASFDDLVDGPIFDRPNEVAWLIRHEHRLARLNFPLPSE